MSISIYITHRDVPCWNFNARDLGILQSGLPGVKVNLCGSEEDFLESLGETETALCWSFKPEWFSLAPRLKYIVTPAAGLDILKLQNAPPGVTVSNSSYHGRFIAETVVGMIFSHARGIMRSQVLMKTHAWPQKELYPHLRNVRGSHVTIVGYGNLGNWIGQLLKPFGAHITGIKRRMGGIPPYFDDDDAILPPGELDRVLPGTDHLVIALPRAAETDNIIGSERLALLPAHACLYNVGRGNAVDDEALARALRSGALSGAYLDVFKKEPLDMNDPLRDCPNCYLLPHSSPMNPDYLKAFVMEFIPKYRMWHR